MIDIEYKDYLTAEEVRETSWGGAKARVKRMTDEEIEICFDMISDIYYDNLPTRTEINDIFWFEDELIEEIIGVNKDEFWERKEIE